MKKTAASSLTFWLGLCSLVHFIHSLLFDGDETDGYILNGRNAADCHCHCLRGFVHQFQNWDLWKSLSAQRWISIQRRCYRICFWAHLLCRRNPGGIRALLQVLRRSVCGKSAVQVRRGEVSPHNEDKYVPLTPRPRRTSSPHRVTGDTHVKTVSTHTFSVCSPAPHTTAKVVCSDGEGEGERYSGGETQWAAHRRVPLLLPEILSAEGSQEITQPLTNSQMTLGLLNIY